jgi:hypothetical protein
MKSQRGHDRVDLPRIGIGQRGRDAIEQHLASCQTRGEFAILYLAIGRRRRADVRAIEADQLLRGATVQEYNPLALSATFSMEGPAAVVSIQIALDWDRAEKPPVEVVVRLAPVTE